MANAEKKMVVPRSNLRCIFLLSDDANDASKRRQMATERRTAGGIDDAPKQTAPSTQRRDSPRTLGAEPLVAHEDPVEGLIKEDLTQVLQGSYSLMQLRRWC